MKNTKKAATKLPEPYKVRKGFRFYCAAVLSVALVLGCSVTAFAANDPITVVNNLSDFIFGLIRAVGLILLGWGIVQVGLTALVRSLMYLSPHARLLSIRFGDVCIPLKAAVFRTFKHCDSIGLLLHSRRPTLINSLNL